MPTNAGSTLEHSRHAEIDELRARLDRSRMPRHVAVIMDGNGRWARQRGWRDRIRGHEAGIDAVRSIVTTAAREHIAFLTLYAFSKENWQRPRAEVEALMRLLKRFLVEEIDEMNENNIRFIATGELNDLPDYVQRQIAETTRATASNTGMVLNLALSYGGRAEIVESARRLATAAASGQLDPADIDAETFSRHLYRPELPDPDLMIRTSGEMRVSNFLLWQIAYTEIHVTKVLWPDFRERHFFEAILDYQGRDRRFGRVK